ncbi:MAG: A24 family peptidase [Candidatus Saccharimonadales bacterium]
MCVHCQHVLNGIDLIPVISWIILKGQCRYCHKKISIQYPIVEISTAIAFIFSYVFWPYMWNLEGKYLYIVWIILLIGLIALFVYDLKWMLLPDRIVFPLLMLATIQTLTQFIFFRHSLSIILGAFFGSVALGGLFYLLFQISKGKWIGGGDVKLGLVLGAFSGGFIHSFMILFIASLLGSFISVPLVVIYKNNRHKQIAFGPFLIVGFLIVQLFGTAIISYYKRRILNI